MANLDRSFSETEKVNLLAEIIKTSPVPHTALLNIIYEYRVEPQWLEVARPPGRSPDECRQAFDQLRASYPHGAGRPPTATYQPPPQFPPRQFVPIEPSNVGGGPPGSSRNIQPRPEGVPHSAYPAASSPYALQAPDQGFKKRGRPSNAELEIRKQEYEARGEAYPPPRSRKRSKQQQRGGSTASPQSTRGAMAGQTPGESGSGGSSQRASFAGYGEASPTSAGPSGRSPGTMEPPFSERPPSLQSQYGHERSYSQPGYAPQERQRTPPRTIQPQPSMQQSLPGPPRLPSPSGFRNPGGQGPILPRPTLPSPHPSQTAIPRPSSAYRPPGEPIQRRTPPPRSSAEPMEH